jgi:hypothetical protein
VIWETLNGFEENAEQDRAANIITDVMINNIFMVAFRLNGSDIRRTAFAGVSGKASMIIAIW